ncbi:uncharacterized protein LOC111701454 [Eurytemora carolleeae]|uniref:uncharacterized protein LOC111701454 n=1 Tax=Eurytemora carolleeae TaxID=1294199 RepID=UPI000C75AA9E|nr:uncharacterized protein LOC111701454 [Eurytemora carolleeae]|eukprot:XP_023328512.1 uncharacterized protein LOC111701454 [Eurytemora affinis]
MQKPLSLDELCSTVDWKDESLQSLESWPGLEGLAEKSSWTRSFYHSKLLKEKSAIFLFYLACTGLEKGRGAELELNLLLDLQNLVFSDQEFYQTSIFFRDKNNKIDEIFRLYGSGLESPDVRSSLERPDGRSSLVRSILDLKQDEAIRSALNPAFILFIKSSHLHPSSLQHCILSLL